MLADIIDVTMATLNARRADELPVLIGEKHVFANGAPPRIVWVPGTDSFTAPEKRSHTQPSILTRAAGVSCHVWGKTLADTEQLLNDLLLAVKDATRGDFEVQGAEWLTEGEFCSSGAACLLQLVFRMPVVAAVATIKTLTGVAFSAALPHE